MNNSQMFAAALDAYTPDDEAALIAAGVGLATLYEGAAIVGAVEVTLNESAGTWQSTPGGQRMFVVPVT